jgi:phosphoglycerol transferase MdoB-like AlkP superfamily enzyme
MDFVSQNWREAGFWIGLALLAWFAIYLIRAPHMAKSAKKIAARAAGALLLVVLGLSSCTFMLRPADRCVAHKWATSKLYARQGLHRALKTVGVRRIVGTQRSHK